METKIFKNGFSQWAETHYVIVQEIEFARNNGISKFINEREEMGEGGFWELSIELTNEFEEKFGHTDWDGNYYDTITEFLNEKF